MCEGSKKKKGSSPYNPYFSIYMDVIRTKERIQTNKEYIIKWFFHEAKKRKKYDFLIKFSLLEEH